MEGQMGVSIALREDGWELFERAKSYVTIGLRLRIGR